MRVPVWLTLGVAALVLIFGVYRIRLAFRSDEDDQRARGRKGLIALPRRTHALVGIVYLLLGAGLVAASFGWNPVGSVFGPKPAARGPTVRTIPIDQLPPAPPTAAPAAP